MLENLMPDIEKRIGVLERSISELDEAVHTIIAAQTGQPDSEVAGSHHGVRDRVWACLGCQARLGIYNEDKCELRVRYKDFLIYVVPGSGGKTSIPCRRCGHMNQIQDDGTGSTGAVVGS